MRWHAIRAYWIPITIMFAITNDLHLGMRHDVKWHDIAHSKWIQDAMRTPTEHTQCKGNYMILPKQNDSMYPSCTSTEWGQSADIKYCRVLSCKESRNLCGANLQTNVRASSFLAKDLGTMSCTCAIQLDTIHGCRWAPSFVRLSSEPLPSSAKRHCLVLPGIAVRRKRWPQPHLTRPSR